VLRTEDTVNSNAPERGRGPSAPVIQEPVSVPGLGLAIVFIAVTLPVEAVYSWPEWLSVYFTLKALGWSFLAGGVLSRQSTPKFRRALLLAGWALFIGNGGHALGDRLARMREGLSPRVGLIEFWFIGACLLVSLIGVGVALRAFHRASDIP
jgi:hypothetical protein